MSKIKYIHCFGTSHTAGGGFEFGSTDKNRNMLLERYYSIPNEPQTQFNFSYPGQLQKIIGNDITILNHAKQGYGDDRIYRIFYDIVTKPGFNKDEHIFIFEFSGSGRQEIYVNEFNEYLTLNYEHKYVSDDDDINSIPSKLAGIAFSYFYETQETYDYIQEHTSFFEKYVDNHIKYKNEINKLTMMADMFLSYIDRYKYNVLFTAKPFILYGSFDAKYETNSQVELGDGVYFKKAKNILEFAGINKLFISHETNDGYKDLHNSFKCNKLTAHIIYNKLISDKYLNLDIIPIDWKWYKEISFIKEKVI